jgi:hypothetical protein
MSAECTCKLNIYIYIIKYLLHVSTHHVTTVTCSKLSAYCNAITLVTEPDTQRTWVLQRYLQLLEQYLAVCYDFLLRRNREPHNKEPHVVLPSVNNAVTPTYAIYHAR